MENRIPQAEFSALPPEYPQAQEYSALHTPELPPLPPEFGSSGQTAASADKKRRSLRQLLALPALVLLAFLCLHPLKAAGSPDEPAPAQSAEPVPALPEGSGVGIAMSYAVRDAEAVRYSYAVYLTDPESDPLWPVSVYTRVTDATGRTVAPADDPDVWDSSRALFEYSLASAGLEGELELCLTAVYTQAGQERQTAVTLPLAELPPAPETRASLSLQEGGGIVYSADLIPQEGDGHDYQLSPSEFRLIWYDEAGELCGQSPVWDGDTLPALNANSAVGGYTAAYEGPAVLDRPTQQADRFAARLTLTDLSTNYPYVVESNVVTLPSEPILSGRLEAFPGGSVDAVFRFAPAPNDAHEYRLRVIHAGQEVHDGDDIMGLSLVDEPGAMEVTGNNQAGYEVHYAGGSAAASIPEGTQLSLYITLVDDTDGKEYHISTNAVDPVERVYEYETYPLGDGKIVVTVYNDTLNFDVPSPVEVEGDYRTILAVDAFPEAGFTEYPLPSALTPDGFSFGGFVVHVDNPMDLSSNQDLFEEYDGDPPVDALITESSSVFPIYGSLTKEDVERVPPSEDGVRYVNIHAVWIEENPSVIQLYLDDGLGNVKGYSQNSPMYSEGYLYLCSYPTPTPPSPDLEFDGWYDENGNRVDVLVCYFSFTPMLYNADGSFAGYDWDQQGTVTLTAHWKKE